MKFMNLKKFVAIPVVITALLAVGCGSKSNTDNNPIGPGGALPAPLPGTGPYPYPPTTGGCQPITGPITFTIQGGYFDSANIVGGRMPRSGQQVGTAMMGSGGSGPYTRQGSDGTIALNISGAGSVYGSSPYSGFNPSYFPNTYGAPVAPGNPYQTTISGVIQLSQLVLQDIQYQFGGGYYSAWGGVPSNPYSLPMPGSYPNSGYYPGQFPPANNYPSSNICVSSIAIDVGHWNTYIYGGNVYLYLNGQNTGYVLYF